MADIANTAGTSTGYQKLGGIQVSTGGITPKESTTHPSGTTTVASVTGIYENRFDDPLYY